MISRSRNCAISERLTEIRFERDGPIKLTTIRYYISVITRHECAGNCARTRVYTGWLVQKFRGGFDVFPFHPVSCDLFLPFDYGSTDNNSVSRASRASIAHRIPRFYSLLCLPPFTLYASPGSTHQY